MAKSWGEWEAALNQGMNPAVLLGLTTEKSDTGKNIFSGELFFFQYVIIRAKFRLWETM